MKSPSNLPKWVNKKAYMKDKNLDISKVEEILQKKEKTNES